jgi:hypothetical protein
LKRIESRGCVAGCIIANFSLHIQVGANMAGSNSSIHGGHHGEEEPPVARAELRQIADSLLEAMERLLDARMPADGQRAPRHQYDESGGENSNAGHDHCWCLMTGNSSRGYPR